MGLVPGQNTLPCFCFSLVPLDLPASSCRPGHGPLLENFYSLDAHQYCAHGRVPSVEARPLEASLMFWDLPKIFRIAWATMKGMMVTLKYYFTPAITYQFPKEKRAPAERFRGVLSF